MAAGGGLTCGIHLDGCAECWGLEGLHESYYNEWEDYGELDVPAESFAQIALVKGGLGEGDPECGVTLDSSLSCWGRDIDGGKSPPQGELAEVGVTTYQGCSIDTVGQLACWGGTSEPLPLTARLRGLSCSGWLCGAIDEAGASVVWALGDVVNVVWEPHVTSGPFVQTDLGDYVCGRLGDGTFSCWSPMDPSVPAAFLPPDRGGGWTSVCSYGSSAVCALGADGHLGCWSEDYDERVIADYPTEVSFSQIACGNAHACGVTVDSEMVCWGDAAYGSTTVPD